MAPKAPCTTKYQYVVTPEGTKLMPADEPHSKDEESPAEYNAGGYLPVKVGDYFNNNRYQVIRKLGWGHFSTVWLVKDAQTHRHSALKVVKSASRYAETARDEIKLLSRVSSHSPTHPGREHIINFLDSFSHQGPEASHICIVFEPLGENLLALIERNKRKGVPRALVKVIAKQILLGLEYLHDECDLVHTDIKPENILISIPDIEVHIHNELSVSPSPTSRRVGVPPNRNRTGVAISSSHQRARKQVQIFESQPLASPGRSISKSAGALLDLNMNAQTDSSSKTSVSHNGSYVAQMHLTRTGGYTSGTVGSLSTSASKLSTVHTDTSLQKRAEMFAAKGITAVPSRVVNSPPSTSSSSSSISSALAVAGSSSLISTPPTSLSDSLGINIMEYLGTGKLENELRTGTKLSLVERKALQDQANLGSANFTKSKLSPLDNKASQEPSSQGATAIPKKPKATIDLEAQLSSAISSSWKATTEPVSSSWKDRISNSFASDKASSKNFKSRQIHKRSQSGISNPGFWKHPGTAAPAPAILVSAVVSAGGQQDDFSKLSTVESKASESGVSTVARSSPMGTPMVIPNKATSLISSASGLFKETSSYFFGEASPSNSSATKDHIKDVSISVNNHLSLLTQTAPSRPDSTTTSTKRTTTRISPPQQVSQLSAHMYHHKPTSHPSPNGHTKTTSRSSRHVAHPSIASVVGLPSTSVTPTPASPAPAAPPSTPIDTETAAAFVPPSMTGASNAAQQTAGPAQPMPIQHRMLPPLTTPAKKPVPPTISIKIADLGNATPSNKHFTEEIQTRQYRAPEAILGKRDWDARADIWSVACVVFELLTAEYLFDPQSQAEFTKDDDHMAQIIELLGDFPISVKMGGKNSRELFDQDGNLRYIRSLKPWPLKRVMVEKYLFSEHDASMLCEFLEPMLVVDMRSRVNARDLKDNRWLEITTDDGVVTDW